MERLNIVDVTLWLTHTTFFLKSFRYQAEGRVITSTFRRRYSGRGITKNRDRNRILKYGAYFIADTDIKKEENHGVSPCYHEIFAAAASACTADKTKSD